MANIHIVVIEGTDGCGKQTQAVKLVERFNQMGIDAFKMSFPNYDSASSGPVKMYLGGELCECADEFDAYQSSILFTVDRLCTMTKIKRDLAQKDGDVFVVCDRYVESNLLFNGAKLKDDEKIEFANWLNQLEYNTVNLPRPEMVLFLNMPTEVSQKLAHGRAGLKAGTTKDIHEQDDEYMRRCYNTGLYYADYFKWSVIDCARGNEPKSIDEISEIVFNEVNNKFHLDEKYNKGENGYGR